MHRPALTHIMDIHVRCKLKNGVIYIIYKITYSDTYAYIRVLQANNSANRACNTRAYINIHACMCVCALACTYVCICMCICVFMYIYIHAYAHAQRHTHIYTYKLIYIYIFMYTHTCTRTHICANKCKRAHAHLPSSCWSMELGGKTRTEKTSPPSPRSLS